MKRVNVNDECRNYRVYMNIYMVHVLYRQEEREQRVVVPVDS